MIEQTYNDGGQEAAGFPLNLTKGGCVARAIAIALELDYLTVYRHLAEEFGHSAAIGSMKAKDTDKFLLGQGWVFKTPKELKVPRAGKTADTTNTIRHLDLYFPRYILYIGRHVFAVVNGVIEDCYHPMSRAKGHRCLGVYVPSGQLHANRKSL